MSFPKKWLSRFYENDIAWIKRIFNVINRYMPSPTLNINNFFTLAEAAEIRRYRDRLTALSADSKLTPDGMETLCERKGFRAFNSEDPEHVKAILPSIAALG